MFAQQKCQTKIRYEFSTAYNLREDDLWPRIMHSTAQTHRVKQTLMHHGAEHQNRSLFNLRRNGAECSVTNCVTIKLNTQLEMMVCGYLALDHHFSCTRNNICDTGWPLRCWLPLGWFMPFWNDGYARMWQREMNILTEYKYLTEKRVLPMRSNREMKRKGKAKL